MTDIEKTTISVRSFAISMWTVIAALLACAIVGTTGWLNMVHNSSDQARDTVQIRQDLTQRNNEVDRKFAEHDTKLDTINSKLDLIIATQTDAKRATDALQKRMDDYRVYKWSTPMQIRNNEEFQELNPNLKKPDAQQIHNDLIPYTP
jgi:Skp family chaperone for outer membrane proteins